MQFLWVAEHNKVMIYMYMYLSKKQMSYKHFKKKCRNITCLLPTHQYCQDLQIKPDLACVRTEATAFANINCYTTMYTPQYKKKCIFTISN